MNNSISSINVYPHHLKQNICGTRARYRDGRKDTAVKVYTINQESTYLMINNVPAVGGMEELQALCDQYGNVEDFRPLDDYPCEEFTEVYLVKYSMFPAARTAKKQLDDKSFLGSALHVCYAPEFESVLETKVKLQERRKYVAWKTNSSKSNNPGTSSEGFSNRSAQTQGQPKKRSSETLEQQQPVTYVWAGKEYTVYPEQSVPNVPVEPQEKVSSGLFIPRQLQAKSADAQSPWGNSSSIKQGPTCVRTEDQCPMQNTESSYQNTISHVRSKISKVSVPNVRAGFKRRKRI